MDTIAIARNFKEIQRVFDAFVLDLEGCISLTVSARALVSIQMFFSVKNYISMKFFKILSTAGGFHCVAPLARCNSLT